VIGLVVVSHSAALADGVVVLAREMGGAEVKIETAGGMADPPGAMGTDAELVRAAIMRAASDDGVLVLMDLGSAVMSAELAVEMVAMEDDGLRVLLCEAPLVEGAVAAAARAGAGAGLEEAADEARSALGMKAGLLGIEPEAPAAPPPPPLGAGAELRLSVPNALGLHARPAARVVAIAGRFDAAMQILDETTGRGPADARSLTAVVTLGAHQGHTIVVRVSGPEADAALAALRELADENFGDENGVAASPVAPAGPETAGTEGGRSEAASPAAPPAAGTTLRGVPASPGIVIGPARLPVPAALPAADEAPSGDPAAELARLDAARSAARADVEAARARIADQAGEAEAAIFDAHLLLLDDTALLDPAVRAIEDGRSAAAAWGASAEAAAAVYRGLDDPYLRERAADVDDVAGRVLRHLAGVAQEAGIAEPGILVARDVTPGDAAGLDRSLVQGLAVARGGATSHAAILARALGIPAVVGLGEAVLGLAEGTPVVLDGGAGTLEVEPAADVIAERERAREAADRRRGEVRAQAREPATTTDGQTLEVAANLGSPAEAAEAVELGADGVGLLRTEFLFLDRDTAPTEDEQRAVYEEIAVALDGRPLIVRTLDAGADKPLRFLRQAPEDNPFLGVRGIRLGLEQPELLRTQLRAILAVAAEHPLRVMFPMVSTLAEYRAARAIVDELGGPPIEVGIMVEVPAVAIAADRFAREVDFFSVGTNDLGQYTMAAERGNEALAGLLSGIQPPLLRLIATLTAAAEEHGRWVGVCGELAGDPAAAVLLAGLGAAELSMAPSRIPEVKATLRSLALADARAIARRALDCDDAKGVADLVRPVLGDPGGR
jgi:phosphoenolpyruvate-protein phosphotransferase/dihydroxyacetone kinase phosphotransfer subunit